MSVIIIAALVNSTYINTKSIGASLRGKLCLNLKFMTFSKLSRDAQRHHLS